VQVVKIYYYSNIISLINNNIIRIILLGRYIIWIYQNSEYNINYILISNMSKFSKFMSIVFLKTIVII